MIIEPQITIFNPKASVLEKIENPYYTKFECPWHRNANCLLLTTNHNNRQFHCLFETKRVRYKYYNTSKSCDIPENFHDLLMLHCKLGSQYSLNFISHFRITSGETIGLFELKSPGYGASIIKPIYLVETFLTYLVLFCEACYRLGGIAPVLNDMKFIYAKTHPILVDININNSLRRSQSKTKEIFSQKKWKKILTTRTSKEIIHYMKLVHFLFFKKKIKHNKNCILAENIEFNLITHEIFCKQKKTCLYDILKTYKTYVPTLSNNIQQILDSIVTNEESIVE